GVDRRRRGLSCGCGGALVGGAADDQCLWPHGGDGLRHDERSVVGRLCSAAWPSDLEHADLCIGRWIGASACWGSWGALHCGGWGWSWVRWAWRADGGAFCCGSVWCWGEADVPQRGLGALARGWSFGVCGASGPSG